VLTRNAYRAAQIVEREIIQQDAIDLGVERLRQFVEILHFDFQQYLAVELACRRDRCGNRTRRRDVVLLHQNGVI
jgi:hypothetical protein